MTELRSSDDDALPAEIAAAAQRVDELVKRFEEHPDPSVQELMAELLQCIDTLHRAGLQRLNALLKTAGLQRRAVDDPEVRLLFDLYDLGEGGDQSRAAAVIDSLRPLLESIGGSIQLLEAEADRVRVRLSHPPGHADDYRAAVEYALQERLPGVHRIEIKAEQPAQSPTSNFVPLSSLVLRRPPEWQPAAAVEEVPLDGLRAIAVGDVRVLLARVGADEVYAYRNECPGTPFPLDAAHIHEGILLCPWHGCRFEVRGGRRVDLQARGLGVLPVRVESGQVVVAIPRAAPV